MKFLENDRLAQLTAQLTEAKICERVINGRIEAFTTKRAGTDKKFAHALGEKYQTEIEAEETEFTNLQRITNTSTNSKTTQDIGNGKSKSDGAMSNPSLPPRQNKKSPPSIRKSAAPPSPKNKRVKIDLKTTTGRKRSVSLSAVPTFMGGTDSTPPLPVSAFRSRSDSYDSRIPFDAKTSFPYSNSPLGDFHDSSTQRLMTDLILTLNASFPDYDFSNIRPSHFSRSPSSSVAVNRTNERLSELAACTPQGANFLPQLWNAIDDVINLNESDVYSYVPPSRDDDDDPLSFLTDSLDGTDSAMPLWTFNFFFVNKSLKRILLFTCVQTMRTEVEMDELNDEDDGYNNTFDNYIVGGTSDEVKEPVDFGTPIKFLREDTRGSRTDGNTSVEEEDEGGLDYDMDPDSLNQAILPPAAVA